MAYSLNTFPSSNLPSRFGEFDLEQERLESASLPKVNGISGDVICR
jgi:hypothetical protein